MEKLLFTILSDNPMESQGVLRHLLKLLRIHFRKFLFLITRAPKFLPDMEISETIASLKRGLAQLNIHCDFNPWGRISGKVGVIASPLALAWALEQKKKGIIRALIAGPGISNVPMDHDRIMSDPAIDKVILPTVALQAKWADTDQYFNSKATIWTAGVADNGAGRDHQGFCVVYSRNADEKLFSHIMETLWAHKVPIAISKYGQFRSREYVRLLKKAKFLIYLDSCENQPLPLYEAWMANVPALVFSQAAADLDPACGLSFQGQDDFEAQLLEFFRHYPFYQPRPYALAHHTDSISAGAYRAIMENV